MRVLYSGQYGNINNIAQAIPADWMSCVLYLQHDPVVIEIWDVPQPPPPDLDIVESHAHPPTCERVSHVVGVTQQKDPWGGQSDE